MKVNVNHPSFLSFIDEVSNNIVSGISVNSYFSMSNDGKLAVQFIVFKFINNALKIRLELTDSEMKSFITVLRNKNEEIENYELSAVINDLLNNFDTINEIRKVPVKKQRSTRRIKLDKDDNKE